MSPWRSAAPKPRDGLRFQGFFAGAGFASGDRLVAGIRLDSPIGPFCDVMWCRPDGTRILIAEGPPAVVGRRMGFGFSECPARPAVVGVTAHVREP